MTHSISTTQPMAGKTVVVTGGSRGIGLAAGHRFASAGGTVVLIARGGSECRAAAENIERQGGKAFAVAADVADWGALEAAAKEAVGLAGVPDVVVVSAGVLEPVGRIWELPPEGFAYNIGVNLVGAFNAIRAFVPAMLSDSTTQDDRVIVLVSSGAAGHASPGWGAYAAAKAGLNHLAANLQAELDAAQAPVRVHGLYPGIVDTYMQDTIRAMSEEQFPSVERFRRYHERGQLRPPEQPAALIHWLTTPAAADLRGQIANIDDPDIKQRVSADLGELL